MQDIINDLFEASGKLNYRFSNGMIPVPKMKGPGFFPGCNGRYFSQSVTEKFEVMVLGQDFDNVDNYNRIKEDVGEIDHNTTWHNLKLLLNDLNIDIQNCFFTNVYMGLRPGSLKNRGKCPAAMKGAEPFANECFGFFIKQLELIKPSIVLVLGKTPATFLANCFGEPFWKWENINGLKEFYKEENQLLVDLPFHYGNIRFVFVIHPSISPTNRSKIWGNSEGKFKEQEILNKLLSK